MRSQPPTRRSLRRRRRRAVASAWTIAALVVGGGIVATTTAAQAATVACFDGDVTVERWVDARGVTMFTTDAAEAEQAAGLGFTATGDAFSVASKPAKNLVPLHDAYRTSTGNHAWILWEHEYRGVIDAGWVDRGIVGYVSPLSTDCSAQTAMTRAVRGALHTVAFGGEEAQVDQLKGYRLEYTWYAPTAVSAYKPADDPTPAPTTAPTETPTPTPTATPTPSATPTPTPTPTATPTPTPTPTTTPTPAPTTEPAPARGDGDGLFTIATYPDTQQEVFKSAGTRFIDRSKWLVSQKDALDLRFVMHTGDVVNWDSDGHPQYVIAENALDPLEEAGIPYQLSIGNHDTMATGSGGGARDPKQTRVYQRTTTTFNDFWSAEDYGAVAGEFEPGKVDNTYSTFTAEGADWLILNLELWPRVAAVDWAEQVIASHPTSNVVIQTHSFLNGSGDIDGAGQSVTRWEYGDSSPQYVYDRLVAPYSNVKVVTSGHVGLAASKVVTTAAGNHVAFLLQTMHSNYDNPTRLSQFDVPDGTIKTKVYAPEDGKVVDENTLTGLSFITKD